MSNVRLFISFDMANDGDLYGLLLEQSLQGDSGFEISARSEPRTLAEPGQERVRRRIRGVDEVIVICGEHTADSVSVNAELLIVQEEQKPYFLLWGRRESMCTRPCGAKPADSMYSWTREILQSQIAVTLRKAQPREIPDNCKRASAATRQQ